MGPVSSEREVLTYEVLGTASRTEQWIDSPWSVLPPVVPGALAH